MPIFLFHFLSIVVLCHAVFREAGVFPAEIAVIVDYPARFEMRIYGDGAEKLESPLFEIARQIVGQPTRHEFFPSRIEDRFSSGETPDVFIKRTEFYSDFNKTARVVYDRVDFSRRFYHTGRFHNLFDFTVVIEGDLLIIETVETLSEYLPLFHHHESVQPALKDFKRYVFEMLHIVVERFSPFLVVIFAEQFVVFAPRTSFFIVHFIPSSCMDTGIIMIDP